MKRIFALLFLLTAAAFAQNTTTVTAVNITDVNQSKLAAGQICFLGTDSFDNPISFQMGGGGQVLARPKCATVTNGVMAALSVPNPANTSPAGIFYRVTVKDTSNSQTVLTYRTVSFAGASFSFDAYAPVVGNTQPPVGAAINGPFTVNGNFSATGSITGATYNVSSALNLLALGTANSGANSGPAVITYNGSIWNGTTAIPTTTTFNCSPASTVPNPNTVFCVLSNGGQGSLATMVLQLNNIANPATSGANFNPPVLTTVGTYWNGAASTIEEVDLKTTLAAGANPLATFLLVHTGTSGGIQVDFSTAKVFKSQRLVPSGTALAAGNFSINAAFGSTSSVSSVTGVDSAFSITLLSGGTGQAVNGGFTLTFADGAWATAPVCVVARADGSSPSGSWFVSSTTTTAVTILLNATVVAASSYSAKVICV